MEYRAVKTLIGCWLIQLTTGVYNCLGNIVLYIVSYFRESRHYDVTEDTFFALQSLMILFAVITFPIGFWLVDRFGGKSAPVLMLGGAISLSLLASIKFVNYTP
jgi:hypothetical protein